MRYPEPLNSYRESNQRLPRAGRVSVEWDGASAGEDEKDYMGGGSDLPKNHRYLMLLKSPFKNKMVNFMLRIFDHNKKGDNFWMELTNLQAGSNGLESPEIWSTKDWKSCFSGSE